MTTNGVNNVEEADMMECDGEKVVTMMDVLQEQEEFEEDANAVLGASDDKECTYSKGYIKRQALYVCLTCCSGAKDDPSQRVGVCLACSLNCHENHELIELYTKRNFRCDCGNPKFKSHPCQFTPNKLDLNEDNHYNQNFSGIYCVCKRPYPDPEAAVEEEMIQCIICEDWLHSTHLDAKVPAHDLYGEMICKSCMEKNGFLHDYSQMAVNYEIDVDVTTASDTDNSKTVDNIQLLNGTLNSCIMPDIDMANENVTGNKDTNPPQEKNCERSNQDNGMNSNKELAYITNPCSAEKSESSVPINTESFQCSGDTVVESEENTKLDDGIKETTYIENNDTNVSIDPQVITDNKVDDNKEQEKTNSEENEDSIKDLKEHLSGPEQFVQENINSTNDNLNCTEISVENNTLNNVSKDGEIDKHSIVSDTTNEVTKQTAIENSVPETTENLSKSSDKDSVTEASKNQVTDCEDVSLVAATKDLSEFMDDRVSNKISNISIKYQQNELATLPNSDNESKTKENGLSDEERHNDTEIKTMSNDSPDPELERDNKRKLCDSSNEAIIKKQKLDNVKCLRPKGITKTLQGATFWPSNFRQKLCTCNECLSMYKDLNVLFLTDIEDTVTAYEALGKEKANGSPATQYEKGLQALSSLDRVQQINALTEYNKMRDKLLDFLKSFKDRKEIVKEEDIKAFFAGMKPRREPDGVYFCR